MSKLTELRGKITERREKLDALFEKGGENYDLSADEVAQVRALNDELTDLSKEHDELVSLENIRTNASRFDDLAPTPVPGGGGRRNADEQRQAQTKSIGQLFVESDAYKGYQIGSKGVSPMAELDLAPEEIKAAVFSTSAGWAPESTRTGVVVPEALRPIQIIDMIPSASTSMAAVVYMEETTATNAAAERAEAGAYAESALVLTQRSKTVRSIGTSLPITDEQLEDVEQARTYVDGRLGFFVRQRLDSQLLNGDDVAPNIQGFLNASGLQTQAKGADPTPDAVYKALTKIRVTGRAFPTGVIFHPTNWQDVRLLRTADGVYIWGNPSEAGPERIWGLQVAQSDAITLGTALAGDFTAAMCQLYIRRGLEVQVGYVNDDFSKGKQTVRAGLRCALVIYRGEAYCTVTGL